MTRREGDDTPLFYAPALRVDGCLPEDESAHAVRVLRLAEGAEIRATDGAGHTWRAVITAAHAKHCAVAIVAEETATASPWHVELAVAPTKHLDRTEWLVEKAVEIGVTRITPLLCARSERREMKTERLVRVAIAAMKQSLRATLPTIDALTPWAQYVAAPWTGQTFIAHCHAAMPRRTLAQEVRPATPVRIIIGPEGDFTEDEVADAIAAGGIPVTLGDHRLRTETAAVVALHTIHVVNTLSAPSPTPETSGGTTP